MHSCVGKISRSSCKNVILPCRSAAQSSLPAEAALLQAAQLPAQGDLGSKANRCSLQGVACSPTEENCNVLLNNLKAGLLSVMCLFCLLSHHGHCALVGGKCHLWLCLSSNRPIVSPTCIQSPCMGPPKAMTGLHLCAHVLHLTRPLAMSLTSAQLHQP